MTTSDTLQQLSDTIADLERSTAELEHLREFSTRPWPERTCSPAKQKARRILEGVSIVLGLLILLGCVGLFAVWAWQEPRWAAIVITGIATCVFFDWVSTDDRCEENP